jgi:hypothetical protein
MKLNSQTRQYLMMKLKKKLKREQKLDTSYKTVIIS